MTVINSYNTASILPPGILIASTVETYATGINSIGRVIGTVREDHLDANGNFIYRSSGYFSYYNGEYTQSSNAFSSMGFSTGLVPVTPPTNDPNGLVFSPIASNSQGQTVGIEYVGGRHTVAVVYSDGEFIDVSGSFDVAGATLGINDAGQVFGSSFTNVYHAFVATPVYVPPVVTDRDTLNIRVSEDAWTYHPDAQFVVKVDGQQVGGAQTATALHSSGNTQDIALKGDFSGIHQVAVQFLNDQYGGASQDVNLYVESVSLNGMVSSGSEAKIDPAVGMTVGSSAVLTHNGTATFNVAPDTLVVHMSEDAWVYHPDAQFALMVDGKQVGEVRSVTALHAQGQSDTFNFTGDFTQGHQVAITFLNDQYGGPGQDVNLYIDSISLNGQTIQGSEAIFHGASGTYTGMSAELFGNGSAMFNVDDLHHAGLLM
jgi:hypothetical protein